MFNTLLTILQNTSALEWGANLTSLVCVILAARNKVLTWPFGIVSCILFAIMFYQGKLYAESLLQFFFIATSLWGWWHWSANQSKPPAPISTLKYPLATGLIAGAIAVGLIYALGLQRWTDAVSPWWDSQILALSMLAQWWLMRRNIATWGLWWVVNTISVPLYFSREYYLSGLFYAVYWVMAIVAYLHWRKALALQKNV